MVMSLIKAPSLLRWQLMAALSAGILAGAGQSVGVKVVEPDYRANGTDTDQPPFT